MKKNVKSKLIACILPLLFIACNGDDKKTTSTDSSTDTTKTTKMDSSATTQNMDATKVVRHDLPH